MVPARIIGALLLAAALSAGGALAADSTCVDDWSIAAPIVKKEGLVTVEQLSALVRSRLEAIIVKCTLCEEKGGYVFHLVVRGANGKLKSVTVDARSPFGP
jgi:hypothetical protein